VEKFFEWDFEDNHSRMNPGRMERLCPIQPYFLHVRTLGFFLAIAFSPSP